MPNNQTPPFVKLAAQSNITIHDQHFQNKRSTIMHDNTSKNPINAFSEFNGFMSP